MSLGLLTSVLIWLFMAFKSAALQREKNTAATSVTKSSVRPAQCGFFMSTHTCTEQYHSKVGDHLENVLFFLKIFFFPLRK